MNCSVRRRYSYGMGGKGRGYDGGVHGLFAGSLEDLQDFGHVGEVLFRGVHALQVELRVRTAEVRYSAR